MDYKIANRLNFVLEQDKMFDPQRVCRVLEKEIKPLIDNYLETGDFIKVRYKKENSKNIFFIEFEANRIKPIGYVPY